MALPDFVLIRSFYEKTSATQRFNISSISPSDDLSAINLELPKKINAAAAAECNYKICCSGNGLLCFYCYTAGFEDGEFVIWNLSTDKCELIPHSELPYHPCFCSSRRCVKEAVSLAFGLSFVADDYKFVRFMRIFNDNGDGPFHNTSRHVAVYSSKTNSWKEVPFPFGFGGEHDISPDGDNNVATCVNGFCYWTTTVDVILSFDLSSDTFSTLPYPDDIGRDVRPWDVFLIELDGSLGLVSKFDIKSSTNLISFWVYEGGSSPWTRKMNLDVSWIPSAGLGDEIIRPLWLGKKSNGEYSLLLHGYLGFGPNNGRECSCCGRRLEALIEYDYSRREFRKIDVIHDDRLSIMLISISPYVGVNAIIEECGEDWISSLPDDIIINILSSSFLSLKEAASTSLLSRHWSDLWLHDPNLNFNSAHHLLLSSESKYIECVNSVVESYRAPVLKELNVSLPLNYSTRSTVTKWLGFAVSRRVELLELNFLGLRRKSDLLKQILRVFKSRRLRSLCLKCLEVGGDAIGLVLRNCPLLERLIIKYAVFTSDVEVCSNALKHLDVQNCTGGASIKVYAPNLTHLKIESRSLIVIHKPLNVDYPQLVWAHPFISSQLTTLEFTIKGNLEEGFPEMHSLRVLIVTYHNQQHSIRPITDLLRALPYLEEFEIKHCRMSVIEQEQQQGMEGVENVFHRHLRVFKFTWFDVSDGDHMALMTYILENCIALEKIILDIYEADLPQTSSGCAAALEYARQLQSTLPSNIQLIVTFNYRQLV